MRTLEFQFGQEGWFTMAQLYPDGMREIAISRAEENGTINNGFKPFIG